jgi:thiamine-monophosphate kinase
VSGPLGGAAAGLMVLEHPELTDRISAEADVAVSRKQLDPHPRLEAGRALAGSGARAMIDISDGLGADAEQLAAASGLAIEVELTRVPVAAGVEEVAEAAGRDPYELLTGGEDYELLAALPRQAFEGAAARLAEAGGTLVEIGRFAGGRGVRLRLPGGRSLPAAGYDQISGRSPGG